MPGSWPPGCCSPIVGAAWAVSSGDAASATGAPGFVLAHAAIALPLIASLPAVLEGDLRQGGRRAAQLLFGLLWLERAVRTGHPWAIAGSPWSSP